MSLLHPPTLNYRLSHFCGSCQSLWSLTGCCRLQSPSLEVQHLPCHTS